MAPAEEHPRRGLQTRATRVCERSHALERQVCVSENRKFLPDEAEDRTKNARYVRRHLQRDSGDRDSDLLETQWHSCKHSCCRDRLAPGPGGPTRNPENAGKLRVADASSD